MIASVWLAAIPAAQAAADISELGDISTLRDPQYYVVSRKTPTRWTFLMSMTRWNR